jgi:Cu/Ag efflux protein CusF
MKAFRVGAALAALALVSAVAEAQAPARIRGTITAVDADALALKSRDGRDLRLQLADNVTVAVAKAARFEDIKQGDYVGSTAMKRADGALVAVEVHYLPPNVPPGHTPWDLQPGSTMTNANVEAIVQSVGRRELVLRYQDGEQKILVPEGIPIVRAVPGSRADLAVGEYVFVAAQAAADGRLTALRIQVSKDGVRPPM